MAENSTPSAPSAPIPETPVLADVQNGHHKNGSVAFAEEAVTVNVGEVKLNGDHKKEPALYKQGHGKAKSVGDMLTSFLKKSASTENLDARSPKHVRSPSSESLEEWTKQRQSEKVSVTWKDLVVIVKPTGKVLLNKVTGNISNGLYAIMGPSGSGKTTLLNTLACRLDRNTKVSGDVRLNGKEFNINDLKKIAGYVMQDDLLNVSLTVEETLKFTAELRLPPNLDKIERQDRIDDVLVQMGLVHARGTVVGHALKKGISGGERKRLCVAMELLTKPHLLFLDEPTSGLDSVTSLALCSKLRSLVDQRLCTVVTTIHQPQAKIFRLFTHLLLLKAGNIVYQGKTSGALEFFESVGQPVPMHENPAEAEKLAEAYKQPEVDLHDGIDHPILKPRETTSWMSQFVTLFRRTMMEQWRKKGMLFTNIFQTVVIALLIGATFYRLGRNGANQSRRQPVLFFAVINQGVFASLQTINSFPSERLLSLRERASGMYYASAYFLAKSTAEMIVQIIVPWIFSVTIYFMVGFHHETYKFFIFAAFMMLTNLAATSLALAVSAVCRTTDMAVTVLPMTLEVCRLFGGFFLPPSQLPHFFYWLDALSYVKYAYVGISINELTGLQYTSFDPSKPADFKSNLQDGDEVLRYFGMADYLSIGQCAACLVAYIVICRAIAFLGIRYIKW